ncbi:MAG TPA: TlpA disulfide reductase family protein [Thermoanaerobaculia bacterium]|nr:TlpA disulfide reductase family protein [Thermoanaerobaculia bacterium]
MTAPSRFALLALAFLVPGLAEAAAPDPGRSALEAAREAYRAAGPFRETLDLKVEFPDGRSKMQGLDYGVGAGGGAFLSLSSDGQEVFRIVGRDGRMVATQFNVAGRYTEVPYDGSLAVALERSGSVQSGVTAPPPVVAAQGGGLDAFLAAFQFGLLGPLQISGFRPAQGESGIVEVDLSAPNGSATVGIDAASHYLRELRMTVGEGKEQVRASGPFRFTAGDPGKALILPDLTGRTSVATFSEMGSSGYPLGQPAPDVTLRTLDGGTVRLADLRGSVVVLDFWATWCVPCWEALAHTEELAAWAKSSGLPVKVFALNTMENAKGEELHRQVAEFLRAKKLDLPVLLDSVHDAFSAFHEPGLPSLVIIGKDGKLARYHASRIADMVKTVRGEVEELLKAPAP